MQDDATSTDVNQLHWDALAEVHATVPNDYYDLARLRSGASSLSRVEKQGLQAAVGSVAGLRVLHLQCHLGMDAISLAREGAHVTGVDFAGGALARASELAQDCGVDIRFVQADATRLPDELHGAFDLVYATIGILNWIGDVHQWMRSVHQALRPTGRLLLIDVHPLFAMFRSIDPLVADFPYGSEVPLQFDDAGSYADPEAHVASTATVEHAHTLAEVVTAASSNGLRILSMAEHLDCDFDPRGLLRRDSDGQFRLRIGGLPVPLLYTLIAARDEPRQR